MLEPFGCRRLDGMPRTFLFCRISERDIPAQRVWDPRAGETVDPEGRERGNRLTSHHVAVVSPGPLCYAEEARDSEQRAQAQFLTSRRAEKRYRTLLDFLPDPVVVFDMDSTVSYLNPAFVEVFGWTLEELEGHRIPFVPQPLRKETRDGIERLFRERVLHGFETRRLTKDGRVRDVVIGAALLYDEEGRPSGQVVILRDVTHEKRVARANQTLFRVSMAMPRLRRLDEKLEVIINEVKDLIGVEGASVILLDEERREFFFPVASYDDTEAGRKIREIRYPADRGVASHVLKTGEPIIVPDYATSPFAYLQVDAQSGHETRDMLDVPICTEDRFIGVLCAVNKKEGEFDQGDVELLSTVATTVAFPIENARIDEELKRSYEEVQSLNRAKDRVMNHLSHELKTPLSVLAATMGILAKRGSAAEDPVWIRALDRAQRNLKRILEIQYEIEDIMRDRDYRVQGMMSTLLDVCTDEIEAVVADEVGKPEVVERIRRRIDETFGQIQPVRERIQLDQFAEEAIETLRPRFAHRPLQLITRFDPTPPILMPRDALAKVIEGLVRNAVENTPDHGRVEVSVRYGEEGPILQVRDYGVGITLENQPLIFKGVFTTRDSMHYSSRRPYEFNAGGKGLDLLRMKIFSERYHFRIRMESQRCRFIPRDEDLCPGAIDLCNHCQTPRDCLESGGTTVTVEFPVAEDAPSPRDSGAQARSVLPPHEVPGDRR
jgi:PAS domain S-box-containing protein